LGHLSEAGSFLGCPERSRLSGDGNRNGFAHAPKDRKHSFGLLFTIGAHNPGTRLHHLLRALGYRVSIAALGRNRTKAHGRHYWQTTFPRASQRDQHFIQSKESLQDEEIDAGVFEQADLL
jgi:hypothetical protein